MPGDARPESALVVIATTGRDVLMLRRRIPSGSWQSVTGGLEAGETPRQAAVREVHEETGIDIASLLGADFSDCNKQIAFEIWPQWQDRYPAGVTHNTEYQFRLVLDERPVIATNPDEHDAHEWLSLDDAIRRASFPSDRAAINELSELFA